MSDSNNCCSCLLLPFITIINIGLTAECILLLNKSNSSLEATVRLPKWWIIACLVVGIIFIFYLSSQCIANMRLPSLILLRLISLVHAIPSGVILYFNHTIADLAEKGFDKLIDDYPQSRLVVDEIQSHFECCGSRSINSWDTWVKLNHSLPASCCSNLELPCISPYTQSCVEAISQLFGPRFKIILWSSFLQIVTIFGLIPCHRISSPYQPI